MTKWTNRNRVVIWKLSQVFIVVLCSYDEYTSKCSKWMFRMWMRYKCFALERASSLFYLFLFCLCSDVDVTYFLTDWLNKWRQRTDIKIWAMHSKSNRNKNNILLFTINILIWKYHSLHTSWYEENYVVFHGSCYIVHRWTHANAYTNT